MPWRYVYEITRGLLEKGHAVSVVSVENQRAPWTGSIDGIRVLRLEKKYLFSGRAFRECASTADFIVWSASTLTPFYHTKLKRLERPLLLLFTGPFYTFREIMRAQKNQVPFRQLATHYRHALMPMRPIASLINATFVKSVVVLSRKSASVLEANGCMADKVSVIPPGYGGRKMGNCRGVSPPTAKDICSLPTGPKIMTYLGSLYQIRGINILMDAFSVASRRVPDLLLLILARTENQTEIEVLLNRASKLGIADRTLIIPGFLETRRVLAYLHASDAVVLPFILVPSDMPLGALEAMALGKPVIATDIDGMPEMVAGRGLVVPTGDTAALAQAICIINQNEQLYHSLKANCVAYMSRYPGWEQVIEEFYALIQNSA